MTIAQYQVGDEGIGAEGYELRGMVFSVSPGGVALVNLNTLENLNSMRNSLTTMMGAALDDLRAHRRRGGCGIARGQAIRTRTTSSRCLYARYAPLTNGAALKR